MVVFLRALVIVCGFFVVLGLLGFVVLWLFGVEVDGLLIGGIVVLELSFNLVVRSPPAPAMRAGRRLGRRALREGVG